MNFEKIFITNDNGRVSGYTQEGTYKDGKIIITRCEKLGDIIHSSLSNKNKNRVKFTPPTSSTNSSSRKQQIESIKHNDEEFIKECEEKIKQDFNSSSNKLIQLRDKLRTVLKSNLDSDILYDFKVLVHIMDHERPNKRNTRILNKLLEKYSIQ